MANIQYRTTSEIWGSFEAPVIGVQYCEDKDHVKVAGAKTPQDIVSGCHTNFVGDVIEYRITGGDITYRM